MKLKGLDYLNLYSHLSENELIHHVNTMKDLRTKIPNGQGAVWTELYNNEKYCKKIMEKDIADVKKTRDETIKKNKKNNKWKESLSKDELSEIEKTRIEKNKEYHKLRLMKNYGLEK